MNHLPENLRPVALKGLAASFACLISASVSAHDIYIWPSYFSVSMKKPGHVSVDITASHTTFRPDFPMASDGLEVHGVDGEEIRNVGAFFEGARRSTFDLPVSADGTYALNYHSGPRYRTSYVIGRSTKPKVIQGDKKTAASEVPEKAKDVETRVYHSIGMSYVTNNAPSTAVLEPSGTGFELVPVTHPADYVTGEEITISFVRDGKPASGQDMVIELEGPQYRDQPVTFELTSNEAGTVTFTPEVGGRYMAKVIAERAIDSELADIEVTRVYYAFEVIYE